MFLFVVSMPKCDVALAVNPAAVGIFQVPAEKSCRNAPYVLAWSVETVVAGKSALPMDTKLTVPVEPVLFPQNLCANVVAQGVNVTEPVEPILQNNPASPVTPDTVPAPPQLNTPATIVRAVVQLAGNAS